MREALAAVGEAVDDCLDRRVWSLTGAELTAAIDAASVVQRKVAALMLLLVRQAHGIDLPREQGATSTTGWLRHRLRITGLTARQLVDDAERLDTAPVALADAVTSGAVSVDQARVITSTVATVDREAGTAAADKALGMMLSWAGEFDKHQLGRLAARILEHVAPQIAEDVQRRALDAEDKRHQRDRYLALSPVGDGRLRLRGLLDRETAAMLRTVLDPLTRPHGTADTRDPGQRRHDALTDLCRLALSCDQLPDSGGEATQLVVTTTFDPLAQRLGTGTLDTGIDISPAAVRRLGCQAQILPAVLGGDGQPLDLGRQRRLFTGPIRRALVLRDGGCAFPGCDRPPRWCAGHHIVHWADGGPTTLDNGVLLCGHHHRAVHHDGWEVRSVPGGHPEFIPPPWVDPQQRPLRNNYHRRC
ncbi:DUF222 domain-containing protein [Plantactinospora sp. GCM10030261]|uniref:HNH endonuclease signature motif containing protein n=1 Tax=Plantactinospora sp. GCM10030261 TaxID=3273420 RepID=UPI0036116A46